MSSPRNLIRLGKLLLTDEKFPDPVVPPDLHLTRAVHADADGNVACIDCGTRVPIGQASMIGSQGYSCGACSARASMAAAANAPAEGSLRTFPWLLVAIVALLIITVIVIIAGA
jgi:hypothetical protein